MENIQEITGIVPLTRRAKNRVREHGNVFWVRKETATEILVVSLDREWFGWFTKGKDIE